MEVASHTVAVILRSVDMFVKQIRWPTAVVGKELPCRARGGLFEKACLAGLDLNIAS